MVSEAPRMISVVMGSAVVAGRARAGGGRGAGVPARGRRERRVFGRELSAMGRGYPERSGVTRVRHGFTCTGEASARTPGRERPPAAAILTAAGETAATSP